MTMTTKTVERIKSQARKLDLKSGEVGNRTWFFLQYIEETGTTPAEGLTTAAFAHIDTVDTFGNSKFHRVTDYDVYKATVNRLIKQRKEKARAETKNRKSKVHSLTELEHRVSALEDQIETILRPGAVTYTKPTGNGLFGRVGASK